MSKLAEILKDTNYGLSIFDGEEIAWLLGRIKEKEVRDKTAFFVKCIVRDRDIQLIPEEVVRQLYAYRLIHGYNYPKNRIKFEHEVHFDSREIKLDVVVFDKDSTEYIIGVIKKSKLLDGKNQLSSHCNATGAQMGFWTNGKALSYYSQYLGFFD